MFRIAYALNKLRTDFFLSGVSDRFRSGKMVPPPSYVLWDCSRRCNLRCAHCGATKEKYAAELTTGQIRRTIDELAAMKVRMFAVTGGEPLLRTDCLDVLAYARTRGLKTGMATNGFLLDEAAADRIREAGVYSVQISLDGTEPTHNRIRGNPRSFEKAVQAVERLLRRRVPVLSVATTVTPQNLGELDAMRGLLSQLGVSMWRLTVVMPIGRAEAADLSLDAGQMEGLFAFVRDHRRGSPRIYLGENLTYLGEWETRLRSGPVICPVGYLACCIGVDGHVRGCPEQPDTAENREGSILESPFAEIWRGGFGRYRQRQILATDPDCSACGWKDDCFGGCWVMRTGNRQCIRRLLQAGRALPAG
ncbi:MAG: radical SAM protein [Anaerolineales bacterium]